MLRAAVVLALAAAAQPAFADDAASNGDNSKDKVALQEVVVTATKETQTIDATPAAITAVTPAQLGPGGIEQVRDLALAVPNLSVGDQFGVNRTFIRGIGMTSIDLGADGAVAFLQDGAMIPRPSEQLTGFYDLQQVEVLRGPQGTLYGRGATAGVINLVTKKPTETPDGYLSLTGGNYSAYTVEGGIGGPLVGDTVMGRIAGQLVRHDGYGKNLFTGSQIDNHDSYAFRGSLRFHPSDALDIVVMGDHFNEDDHDYAFHYFGPTVVPENQLGYNALGGQSIFGYYASLGKKPNLRNIYSDQEPINRRHGSSATAIIDWSLDDNWKLKSVTAWRDFSRYLRDDLDVSNVWMFGQNNYIEDSTSWSQDFTLNGEAGGVQWLAGATYFHEKMHGEVKVPLINLGLLFGLPADTFNDGNYWQNGDVLIDAFGAFLQGKYSFNDQWAVTLGARYNYEKRKGTGSFIFDALGVNVPTDKQKSWDAITPKLLVEYTNAYNGIAYGQVTKGFKSGVINVGSQNDVIDPEYVWSYEVGYKQPFAEGRASLRSAVFYYDYTNLQVGFVNEQSVVQTVNAASARNIGAELELVGQMTQNLSGSLSATLLDAKYTNFVTGDYRQGFALVNLKGNYLQNAPRYTMHAALDYRYPLPSQAALTAHIDGSYQDKVYFTEFNNADAVQPAYGLLNVSAGWQGADGHWAVTAWVRNLTDEFVISNNIITAPLYGSVRVGSMLPPRTYGITVDYKL